MTDYSDDQLKDLLEHIAETVRPDKRPPGASDPLDGGVIEVPDLANAFRKCGIPAQASFRRLMTTDWKGSGAPPLKVIQDTPNLLTVGGLLFNPWPTHFTDWDSVMNEPAYVSIQDDHQAKGLACEWSGVLTSTPPQRLDAYVEDVLVEIIAHWQVQTQREALEKETALGPAKAVSPPKKM